MTWRVFTDPGYIIGSGIRPGLIQRIFITANPVLQTHFPIQNTKTLTGNFRVGALCRLPTAATTVTLHGQLASVSNYFKVLSTGFASISIGGSVVTSTVLATKDSKLRIYDVVLSGNDFLFQEDGVTIDTVTDAGAAANSFVIDVLCQSNGADFFDGTYADPKITDLTTSSNSVSWLLNLATGNTEPAIGGGNDLTYNNAPDSTRELFTLNQSVTPNRWVGVELWIDNNIVVSGDWSFVGNRIFNLNGSAGTLIKPSSMNDTSIIQTTFDYIKTSGDMRVGNNTIQTITESGSYDITGADSDAFGFKRHAGSVVGQLSNVSAKHIIEVA